MHCQSGTQKMGTSEFHYGTATFDDQPLIIFCWRRTRFLSWRTPRRKRIIYILERTAMKLHSVHFPLTSFLSMPWFLMKTKPTVVKAECSSSTASQLSSPSELDNTSAMSTTGIDMSSVSHLLKQFWFCEDRLSHLLMLADSTKIRLSLVFVLSRSTSRPTLPRAPSSPAPSSPAPAPSPQKRWAGPGASRASVPKCALIWIYGFFKRLNHR